MKHSRVEYVGDDPALAALYSYVLREAGYETESTMHLVNALAHCEMSPPNILILQHNLSQESWTSITLYQHLRNVLKLIELPILVIRCEKQMARQRYTSQLDQKLAFLPIVFTVEEFLSAIEAFTNP